MAIQDFTAGQVLTAAQMDSLQANDFNQTVSTKTANYTLVAADKGTRVVMNAAGATTITVNDSLFTAGDTLQLQNIGAGVCTVTAGTATVSSAGPLAIPQFGSGTLFFSSAGVAIYFPSAVTIPPASSGLNVVQSETVFTNVASFNSNASIFTSAYSDYLINLRIDAPGTFTTLLWQGRTAGSTNTTANYLFQNCLFTTTQSYNRNTGGATAIEFYPTSGTDTICGQIFLSNPQTALKTLLTAQFALNSASIISGGGFDLTTSFDAFTITSSSGNITGSYTVFGFEK